MHFSIICILTMLCLKDIHLFAMSNILEYFDCPPKIGDHLNWWYHLRPKTFPQKCLQILNLPDRSNVSTQCFMQRLLPLNFSFYIRSVAEEASNTLELKLNSVYKSCPTILVTSLNHLFKRNCSDKSLKCQRLFPHTWIVVYSLSNRQVFLNEKDLDYIRDNALHVFIMTENQTKYFIRESLSDQLFLVGNINKKAITTFIETFRIHPLFRNGVISGVDRRNTFRISFFECPPYVMIGHDPDNQRSER